MYFTEAEFYKMIEELSQDPPVYKTLFVIIDKSLPGLVVSHCKKIGFNADSDIEDIMQLIRLNFKETVRTKFMFREGPNGPNNSNPKGFDAWMKKVAKNTASNYVKGQKKHNGYIPLDEVYTVGSNPFGEIDQKQDRVDTLSKAFQIALSLDSSIYMILTWLAHFVFILYYDIDKIDSTNLISGKYEDYTLNELYKMLKSAAEYIPWIVITEKQDAKIRKALLKKVKKENITYGEMKYKDFYMKKNGEADGNKSISNWSYRINEKIKEEFDNSQKNKK